ncbi:hypothetical protein HW555_000562 [Spodoptera exigua]|uniref:Uncharacterized protein n=1 Tax=Spodoptera exigua TaxID=7107 RepID=A0A835GW44_SPOEX|nr:hypothetical protein HW555_000562 [Spodoptera exigua]
MYWTLNYLQPITLMENSISKNGGFNKTLLLGEDKQIITGNLELVADGVSVNDKIDDNIINSELDEENKVEKEVVVNEVNPNKAEDVFKYSKETDSRDDDDSDVILWLVNSNRQQFVSSPNVLTGNCAVYCRYNANALRLLSVRLSPD